MTFVFRSLGLWMNIQSGIRLMILHLSSFNTDLNNESRSLIVCFINEMQHAGYD